MKKLVSLFLALVLLFSAALAEDGADEAVEEIVEDVMLDDEEDADEAGADGGAAIPDQSVFTPSYGSPWQSAPGASSYWTLPMDITDEEAVWNMLMEPITVVDIGKKKGLSYSQLTKQNIYMYLEPDEDSKIVGEITNLSQGVRVIEDLGNGWTHVECYSSSFFSKPATKIKAWNILVSGYVKSKYLRQVQPTDKLALVIDKLSQHLYVFQEGKMIAELLCSTGLVQWNGKKYQPYNETRSGEYNIIYTKTGALNDEDSGMVCSYALKFNAADYFHEVPHKKNADGTKNFRGFEEILGKRASHGCIRVQAKKNPAGYCMSVLADLIKKRKDKAVIKFVIWEDYQGRQVKIPADDTPLYYNPKGGSMYHSVADCTSIKKKFLPLTAFTFGELEEEPFHKLKACPYCQPTPRKDFLEEINQVHQESSPGEIMSIWQPKQK